MKKKAKKIVIGLVVLFFLQNITTSVAQVSIDDFLWGDDIYVISPSKKQQHVSEAPAMVIVITGEMIKERGYRDLKDVFNDLPGFDISTNIYGEFSTLITQRGIGGNNKIVLLLNGVPVTSPSGKQFQFGNNVPVWNLKHIEIVYGPASALYGANAFSIINMITDDSIGELLHVNAMGGQNNTLDTYVSLSKQITDDISFSGFFRKYITDGPNLKGKYPELADTLSGLMYGYNDPVDDWNMFFKLKIKDLSLSFHYSDYKEQLSKALEPDDHYMYSKDSWWGHDLWQFNMNHIYTDDDKLTVKSNVTYSKFEINPDMNWVYYSGWSDDNKIKVHQYGIMSRWQAEFQVDYSFSDKFNLTGGTVFSYTTGLPIGDKTGAPFDPAGYLCLDNYYNDTYTQCAITELNEAVYMQLDYRFSENFRFIAGNRFDNNSNYGSTNNPRLGIIFQKDSTTVKLLGGTAYIAPGLFHRYEVWFTTEYGHIQNEGLKPEKLKTLELNWMQNFDDKLKTSVSLYYNHAEDLIVRKSFGDIKIPEEWYEKGGGWIDGNGDSLIFVEWSTNYGELQSYGLDLDLDYVLNPDFKVFGGYSFLDGFNTDPETGDELDLFKTSTHKVCLGFTCTLFEKLHITPRFRWVSDIATRRENSMFGVDRDGDYIPESPHERMPGYKLVNLAIYYENFFKRFDAHININNLLNEKYYTAGVATEGSHTYLPRVPQNLFSITAGLSFTF